MKFKAQGIVYILSERETDRQRERERERERERGERYSFFNNVNQEINIKNKYINKLRI